MYICPCIHIYIYQCVYVYIYIYLYNLYIYVYMYEIQTDLRNPYSRTQNRKPANQNVIPDFFHMAVARKLMTPNEDLGIQNITQNGILNYPTFELGKVYPESKKKLTAALFGGGDLPVRRERRLSGEIRDRHQLHEGSPYSTTLGSLDPKHHREVHSLKA